MISAGEIYDFINGIAPFDTAMGFDNAGLLIGGADKTADRVLLALDVTPAVISEAEKLGAGIIVTHHPVIFDPLKRLDCRGVPYLAARADITVISAHTNLDTARGGVNDTLAELIGVEAKELFDEDCALLGELAEELSCTELAAEIKSRLGLGGLRYTDCGRKIKRVLVSCGAGGSNISLARRTGADALITGEIKHNYIIEANSCGTAVFDLGHYGSEKHIVPKLKGLLEERFPGTEFIRAAADTDGVMYI